MQTQPEYKINCADRIKQVISFEGLVYNTIRPTDADGLIEYKNRAWVMFEIKHRKAECGRGQKLALERFAIDTMRAGKKSISIIAEHEVDDHHIIVVAACCMVREIYFGTEKKWRPPHKEISLKDCVDKFLLYVDKE